MTKKEAVLSEWFFETVFSYSLGWACPIQNTLMASAGHTFVTFFLWAFFSDCPGKTGISSCFEPIHFSSELTPPFYATDFVFADTMILRDQRARRWGVWDDPVSSKSHPNVRQDLCLLLDFLTLLNIKSINLLLRLVKTVLFYKYSHSTVRGNIEYSNHHRRKLPCHSVTWSNHFSQESSKIGLHEMFVMVWGYHHSSECFLFQCTWPGLNCFAYKPTLSHTWYVSRGDRTRILEEAGSTGGDGGHMKLNPAGQDAAGSVSVEAGMPGSVQNGQTRNLRVVEAGLAEARPVFRGHQG